MADPSIEDLDEGKLDFEALQDKAQMTKEIDALGFEQERFDDIEREFKQFLEEIIGNQNLEKFKQEYQKIHKTLKTSYEGEKKLIKKCKELNNQIFEKASNVRAAIRMASNEVEKISALKGKVSKAYEEVQNQREKEEKQREKIQKLRGEISHLKRQSQQETDLEEDNKLRNLRKIYEELTKQREDKEERLESIRGQTKELMERRKTAETEVVKFQDEIEKMNKMMTDNKEKTLDKEAEKTKLNEETTSLRNQIKQQKKTLEEKAIELSKIKEENRSYKSDIEIKEDEIKKSKEYIREKENDRNAQEKDLNDHNMNQQALTSQAANKETQKVEFAKEVHEMEKKNKRLEKELNLLIKKNADIRASKDDNEATKGKMKIDLELMTRDYEKWKKSVEEDKKDIDQRMRERDLLNKDVVTAEEKERDKSSAIQTLDNQLKKLTNKILGYKAEAQKLQKLIYQLEKDKQKYGIEASQANAKYYQCLEQVKLKNNLITKLQKKNIEAEGRLKQQQNLYEAVRSDRNLYSKNLLEAQEEIAELKMKFRRMTQQISQLKEEINSKDLNIHSETLNKQRYFKENEGLKADIERISRHIESSEEMIKTQENDIARLKYVISEAESEKQKQRKDYEMVINERDILGTQLIKRNEELALLYEKIKIQKSTLKKGEIYYQERTEDIINIKKQIAELKRELIVSQNETACIPDLKREIYLLQKEYLEQQQKAKFLLDELEKPLNVHRWRKLECTDPETYEMIQKIQSLQKRLIAKTEEVSEKDVLIQEKEKLYIELKNILAKQSGPEVAEKLQVYQQNLKERSKQLKDMVGELKNYQSQVNAYRFEIERLDKKINEVKHSYFDARRSQNMGVIQEMEEEHGNMQDMMM